ncbi:hypothetical protein [Synechococcus sp. PCC 6312]|nr:hypothetical protein [Synechococcus sp. PCC 6312]
MEWQSVGVNPGDPVSSQVVPDPGTRIPECLGLSRQPHNRN